MEAVNMTELAPAQEFLGGKVVLRPGDCRDVLKSMPDASVDSVVTDPPYALVSIVKRFGNEKSHLDVSEDKDLSTIKAPQYSRLSGGFMGAKWDVGDTAFAVEFWAEVYRVLKPGGYVAAFSGTRTYHRLACAIEDSGFEIRDQLAWAYGSGFPKSHSVQLGIWRAVINCQSKDNAPLAVQLSSFLPLASREAKEPIAVAPALILPEGAPALIMATGRADDLSDLTVMSLSASEAESISLSTGWSWEKKSAETSDPRSMSTTETRSSTTISSEIYSSLMSLLTQKSMLRNATLKNGWTWPAAIVAKSSVDDGMSRNAIPMLIAVGSATWNPVVAAMGLGSALKPSWEPIVLARKPIEGTLAANFFDFGTGALNIDATRVGTEGGTAFGRSADKSETDSVGGYLNAKAGAPIDAGRWPANIMHDGSDEVLAAFPETNGVVGNTQWGKGSTVGTTGISGNENPDGLPGVRDSGSAARFFYSAKADKLDRIGSKHPTVKPVDLMQWLCRLVTPPGGVVLDPFAGSGSTGEAAWREGFSCILVERETEYQADIAERLRLADKGPRERKQKAIKQVQDAGPLFGAANDNPVGGGRQIYGKFADQQPGYRPGRSPEVSE